MGSTGILGVNVVWWQALALMTNPLAQSNVQASIDSKIPRAARQHIPLGPHSHRHRYLEDEIGGTSVHRESNLAPGDGGRQGFLQMHARLNLATADG